MALATRDRALRAAVIALCLLATPQVASAICTPTAISQAEVASAGERADLVVIGRLEEISGATEVLAGRRLGSGMARIVVERIASGALRPGEELVFPYAYVTEGFCTDGFDPPFETARSAVYLKRSGGTFEVLLSLPMGEEGEQ